jgi:hypothetical protein
MTEKEFILSFLKSIFVDVDADINDKDRFDIEGFLEEHHKTYYEVEFVKRDHYNDSEPLTFKGVIYD